MNVIIFLNSYQKTKKQIEYLQEKIRYIENLVSVKSPTLDGMPKGSSSESSQYDNYLIEKEKLEEELKEKELKLEFIKRVIWMAADHLDIDAWKIIMMRYVDCESWDYIISKIKKSKGYVFKMHRNALSELKVPLEKITKEIEKNERYKFIKKSNN